MYLYGSLRQKTLHEFFPRSLRSPHTARREKLNTAPYLLLLLHNPLPLSIAIYFAQPYLKSTGLESSILPTLRMEEQRSTIQTLPRKRLMRRFLLDSESFTSCKNLSNKESQYVDFYLRKVNTKRSLEEPKERPGSGTRHFVQGRRL